MAITIDEVKNLADLARLNIVPEELEKMTQEVGSILGYVGVVQKYSGDGIREVPNLRNVMRDDVVTNASGEYTEDLLKNAPQKDGNYLVVKKIL
jgi:aspartyl-tRNA(Asn)/glutamyl-tRNA(Gln) amidotransferase subunit C